MLSIPFNFALICVLEQNEVKLTQDDNEYFEIPLESLKVIDIENLYVVGKIIDATFLAQAAIRIIPNCITMGENLGKYISNMIV